MWTLPPGPRGTGEGKGKGKPRTARATLGVSGVTEGVGEGRRAGHLRALRHLGPWPPRTFRCCLCDTSWPGSVHGQDCGACTRATQRHRVPGAHPRDVGEGAGCRASAESGAPGGGAVIPHPSGPWAPAEAPSRLLGCWGWCSGCLSRSVEASEGAVTCIFTNSSCASLDVCKHVCVLLVGRSRRAVRKVRGELVCQTWPQSQGKRHVLPATGLLL